ncbi:MULTISPECIES: DUF7692 domain-containing protein [Salinibaculum]|uniref:DUF7692 domain-containing protein n=1 Tax=Salinibaculum TaxID=2732368 RepID=UPI0030D570EF
MRINTDGKKEFREDLYDDAADVFGENTRVGGIDRACRHAYQDAKAKKQALEWIEKHLAPEQAAELCEILSTREMDMKIETTTSLHTD